VARGYFPESQVGVIHRHLEDEFARRGVAISSWKFCPHHPIEGEGTYKVACDCRKPSPGMLLQAAKELNLDLPRSFMLGDKRSDLEAGFRAGCRTVLVRTGHGAQEELGILPGLTGFLGASDSLTDAARLILRASERDAPTLNHLRALA
jgi:D-glycero-D-manno-heptose 1,7-bisphosphate phosphatase